MQAVHIEATWTSRELLRWNLSSLVSHLLREGWLLPHYSAKNSWILGKNGKKCLHAITILVNSPHWRWKEKKKIFFPGKASSKPRGQGILGHGCPDYFTPIKKERKKKANLQRGLLHGNSTESLPIFGSLQWWTSDAWNLRRIAHSPMVFVTVEHWNRQGNWRETSELSPLRNLSSEPTNGRSNWEQRPGNGG